MEKIVRVDYNLKDIKRIETVEDIKALGLDYMTECFVGSVCVDALEKNMNVNVLCGDEDYYSDIKLLACMGLNCSGTRLGNDSTIYIFRATEEYIIRSLSKDVELYNGNHLNEDWEDWFKE